MRGWCVILIVGGCGRIGFDSRDGGVDVGADAYTGCTVVAAAAGREHTCALDAVGNVWCFGHNNKGQIIANGPPYVVAPTKIALSGTVAQLASGRHFSCARMIDGTVTCWGEGALGQHGDGTMTSVSPTSVMLGTERAVDIAASAHSACIIRESDRSVMCWGSGQFFATGQPAMTNALVPVAITGTAGSKKLALGHRFGCAIDTNDQVQCWGHNQYGQLAVADMVDRSAPITLAGLDNVQDVATGGSIGCAVANGDVRCWGDNSKGQLGLGDIAPHPGVAAVAASNVSEVAANSYGWCARQTDGRVLCTRGPMPGFGEQSAGDFPTPLTLSGATDVLMGYFHHCVLYQGVLGCWGSNTWGELGRGARGVVPTLTPIALSSVRAMTVSQYLACAIASDGLYCWGGNGDGQIGDGTFLTSATPRKVTSPPLGSLAGVTTRVAHTCAWDDSGAVACWGQSNNGRLGFLASTRHVTTPTLVTAVSGALEVGAGESHTCARTPTDIICWGGNGSGQLGNNSTTDSVTPVAVINANGASQLSVGDNYGCAIVAGTVRCWGQNGGGQLGNNTTTEQRTAVMVAMPGTAASIAAGTFHTCGINTASELYCWGRNQNGEVGDGTTTMRTSPTRVNLPAGAASVAVSQWGTCARLVDNRVYCWGGGPAGMLAVDSSLVPVHVPEADGALTIARSMHAVCTIDAASTMACWGHVVLAADAERAIAYANPAPAAIPACP